MDNNHTLPIGTILKSPNHDYRIEEVLGKGGFGITYKVSTTVTFDNVPIFTNYTLKEHFLKDACERDAVSGAVTYSKPLKNRIDESLADFVSEARRLNSISGKNPNVVPVSEVFDANNTTYYVMEYLNGGSLRDYINSKGPLSLDEALMLMRPIIVAVSFLHKNKINHLDIKPDNIMFRVDYHTGAKTPVLIDFGLAKHFDDKGKPTSTIRVQGCSDGYAPIEQYSGLKTFSPQADVYALAATLCFLLTGKTPTISSDLNLSALLASLPASVSDEVKSAISHAMAYRRDDRTPSVDAFLQELDQNASTSSNSSSASSKRSNVTPPPINNYEPKNTGKQTRVISGNASKFNAKKTIIAVVCAVVAGLLVWGCVALFSAGGKSKENKSEYEEYIQMVDSCEVYMQEGSSEDWEKLVRAQELASKIETIEFAHYDIEDKEHSYNELSKRDLMERLKEKLHSARIKWQCSGDEFLDLDNNMALENYRIAYQLEQTDSLHYLIEDLERYSITNSDTAVAE